jgi:hypothetical protein
MRAGYRAALCLVGCLALVPTRPLRAGAETAIAISPLALGAATTPPDRPPPSPTGFEARAELIARIPPSRPVVLDTVPIPAAPPLHAPVWQSGLLRPDRLHHTSFALASGLAIGLLTREPVAGLGGSLTLGLIKEMWDSSRARGFDLVDLAADAIGAGTSTLLTSGLLLR